MNSRRPGWTSKLVVVAGATGGVGQLVVGRLCATRRTPVGVDETKQLFPQTDFLSQVTQVRALVRDAKRARSTLPVDGKFLTLHELKQSPSPSPSKETTEQQQLDENQIDEDLQLALKGASTLIICTGTTAFPTRAWKNGNTPRYIDDVFTKKLINNIDKSKIQRIVLASSIGTGRPNKFPFFILNLFGALDAKRNGENHVRESARMNSHAYSIIRVGRLLGGPQTNIGMLRSDPKSNWKDITVSGGDNLLGELSRDAAADAIVFSSHWDSNANLDFSVVHAVGCSPTAAKWQQLLQSVESRATELAGS